MPTVIDQLGRTVAPPHVPRRIVSLVPSITELLHFLGLEDEVVGITKFCTHPAHWYRNKTRIGGTKTIDVAGIEALAPDLIIANKEENDRNSVELLLQNFPVYISQIKTIEDALVMIEDLGQLLGKEARARKLIGQIRHRLELPKPFHEQRAVYFIWQQPYMVAGGDTYISSVMTALGLHNIFADRPRYPEVSLAECAALGVQQVLLSSEPFPFGEKHVAQFRRALPRADIHLVDGTLFSWYGPRLAGLGPAFLPALTTS